MNTKNTGKCIGIDVELAFIPTSKCAKCHKVRRYQNPLARCWECKQKFCYNDINCLQVNSTMKETDEVRNICDECKKNYRYQKLED